MKNKIQINARIDEELRRGHKLVTDYAGCSLEETTEAAIRFFYGSTAPGVLEIRKRALTAAKQLQTGAKLPFNQPLAPFSRSAVVG